MACTPLTWDSILVTFDSVILTFDATEICVDDAPPMPAAGPTFNDWDVQVGIGWKRKRKTLIRQLLLLG